MFLNKMTVMDNGCLQQLRLLVFLLTLIMFEIKAILMHLLIGALLTGMRDLFNGSGRSHLVFVVLESTQVMCLGCMDHIIVYFVVFHCIDYDWIRPLLLLIFYFLNELHLGCVFLLDCPRCFLNSRGLLWFTRRLSRMHASVDISSLSKLFRRKRFSCDFFRTFVDNSI